MKLLLLSNSTNQGEKYLAHAQNELQSFLGKTKLQAVFIPYAAVTFSFDEYEQKVKEKFREIGYDLVSAHHYDYPADEIDHADCIVIGGGNTFRLLHLLQKKKLTGVIAKKIGEGIPYIGWSAGANIACPTICTTNDMPVCETDGLKALSLIRFQINPHYTEFVQPGHAGETRDQRIQEFLVLNPETTVVGLREGSILKIENNRLTLIGRKKARIFRSEQDYFDVSNNEINDVLHNKV